MTSYLVSSGTVVCLLNFLLPISAGYACLSNPCINGICIDDINSTYSCYCIDGFTGVQCQTNWDECWSSPCENGGTCIDGIAAYNCSCTEGFVGENCEVDFNECNSNPCFNNGTCIDIQNGYECICLLGYTGIFCETDVAVCNISGETRCANGGQCVEGRGMTYSCKCTAGWTGAICDEDIDECKSSPCLNGAICIDGQADYSCACLYGFTGKSCEVIIELCLDSTCVNNALCIVENNAKTCYCVPDFHGERCQFQYDECLLGPGCMNGGTCIDGIDNFTCTCPPLLTGLLCECLIGDGDILDCEYVSPTPLYIEETSTLPFTTSSSIIYYNLTRTDTTLPIDSTTITLETITDSMPTTTEVQTSTIFSDATTELIEITLPNLPNTTLFDRTTHESSEISTFIPVTGDSSTTLEITTTEMTVTEKYLNTTLQEITTTMLPEDVSTTISLFFTNSPLYVTETTQFDSNTTIYDNASLTTTIWPDCSLSGCMNGGSCLDTLSGFRCVCSLNFDGPYCDHRRDGESAAFRNGAYVSHKLSDTSLIRVGVTARTLSANGLILSADLSDNVYMHLYCEDGLLKFKFSCGYQTMLLSELKSHINNGFLMRIEVMLNFDLKNQHCNASLTINNTLAMSGGQIALFKGVKAPSFLYLGALPNIDKNTEHEMISFTGCMYDLMINDDKLSILNDAAVGHNVKECSSLICLSNPCLNGGLCSDHGDRWSCSCPNGFMGKYCQTSVCENNPCQFGGSCVPYPGSGFLCLCPLGKHGLFCEHNLDISRPSFSSSVSGLSSYIVYSIPQNMASRTLELNFKFQPDNMEQISLMAFLGGRGYHNSKSDHLAVTFVKGYIMLTWNLGNGPRRVFTSRPISFRIARPHSVQIMRKGRTAWMSVDRLLNISGNAPGPDEIMNIEPLLYIGGHETANFSTLPHDLPLHTGFSGCIWDVTFSSVSSERVGNLLRDTGLIGRSVGQCGVTQCHPRACGKERGVCVHHAATYACQCSAGWFGPICGSPNNPCDYNRHPCGDGVCVPTDLLSAGTTIQPTGTQPADFVCDCPYGKSGPRCASDLEPSDILFKGARSYLETQNVTLGSVKLSLGLEIKPVQPKGLILFASTSQFYTSLSMQGGLLEYRWTDFNDESVIVRSSVYMSLEQWHVIRIGRYGSKLYLWVDGAMNTEQFSKRAFMHINHNTTIHLGGAKDLSKLPLQVMTGPPVPFKGCVRRLIIDSVALPLDSDHIKESRNIDDCDGDNCGGDVCLHGGTCSKESGHIVCLCPPHTTGKRCTEIKPCTEDSCGIGGRCFKGKCVCNNGWAGINCQDRVKIDKPQFDGSGFMIIDNLIEKDKLVNSYKQNMKHNKDQDYLSFNFTTAHPDGIMMWSTLNSRQSLLVGLEGGYLKIILCEDTNNINYTLENSKIVNCDKKIIYIRQAGFLSDGEWHSLKISYTNGNITIYVNDNLTYEEEPGVLNVSKLSTPKKSTYIGGLPDNETYSLGGGFYDNFKGCLSDISIYPDGWTVSDYSEYYGENVMSCQLFP